MIVLDVKDLKSSPAGSTAGCGEERWQRQPGCPVNLLAKQLGFAGGMEEVDGAVAACADEALRKCSGVSRATGASLLKSRIWVDWRLPSRCHLEPWR